MASCIQLCLPFSFYHLQATSQCREQGLEGSFLQACVFDAVKSGDSAFVSAVAQAAQNYRQAQQSLDERSNGGHSGGVDGDGSSLVAAWSLATVGLAAAGAALLAAL
jgi:hypothetical protein